MSSGSSSRASDECTSLFPPSVNINTRKFINEKIFNRWFVPMMWMSMTTVLKITCFLNSLGSIEKMRIDISQGWFVPMIWMWMVTIPKIYAQTPHEAPKRIDIFGFWLVPVIWMAIATMPKIYGCLNTVWSPEKMVVEISDCRSVLMRVTPTLNIMVAGAPPKRTAYHQQQIHLLQPFDCLVCHR